MNFTVVVAEDETLLLQNIIKKIEKADLGFTVVGKAQTGIQALELVEKYDPFLLITDIRMPVMNGLELIENAQETHPNLDTIIVSGYSDFEYAKTAIHLKVKEYLLKPVDEQLLYAALENLRHKYLMEKNELEKVFSADIASCPTKEIAAFLRDYINKEYCHEINLNLIADNLNYSPSYLTKIFLQYYNVTPTRYIISLRIQKAKQLMDSMPEITVHQVGEIIGYPDQGYFSRIFKKYTGVSPQKYRRG